VPGGFCLTASPPLCRAVLFVYLKLFYCFASESRVVVLKKAAAFICNSSDKYCFITKNLSAAVPGGLLDCLSATMPGGFT